MVPLGYIFHGGSQLFSCNIFHMASFSIVESLDLGKALVDEKKALVTYKRLAEKDGLKREDRHLAGQQHEVHNMRGPRELVRGTGGRQDHPSHHRLGHSMGHEYRQVDQGDTRSSQGLMGPEAEGNSGG